MSKPNDMKTQTLKERIDQSRRMGFITPSLQQELNQVIDQRKFLLNACIAALSQLTQDRPEYLESDIKQLKDAIKMAEGRPKKK